MCTVLFSVAILAFPEDFKLRNVFSLEKYGNTSAKLYFSFRLSDTYIVNEVVSHLDRSYPWNFCMIIVFILISTHH